jgi:AraC family transcriptional regulator
MAREHGFGGPAVAARASLNAAITSAGFEERTSTTYDWHGLKRGSAQFCLLQYTLEGRGQLAWEGTRHSVRPGHVMLLWFPHDNRYWLGQGDRWRHFYLCLAGSEVLRAWRSIVARHGPLIDLERDSPAIENAAQACLATLRGEVRDAWSSSALAYGIAMALCAELLGEPSATATPTAVAAAKRFGLEHFTDGIGVHELAHAAGMSRHHFARLFARSEGTPPSQWLIDLRMREATRLLRGGEESIALIGRRCGFADPAYFCRAFRRHVGLSPGEFRSSGMY